MTVELLFVSKNVYRKEKKKNKKQTLGRTKSEVVARV